MLLSIVLHKNINQKRREQEMTNSEDTKATFDLKRVQPVTLSLLNGQVDIILRALELYGYNLEFMLNTNGESISNKEKDKKLMMLKFTYEQVLATQAEQVNGKADNMDNISDFGKLLLKDTEMINFADEKKFKAIQ